MMQYGGDCGMKPLKGWTPRTPAVWMAIPVGLNHYCHKIKTIILNKTIKAIKIIILIKAII